MRTIKFRAFIQDDNIGEEPTMVYNLAFEEYAPINDLLNGVKYLMQFTGLKDINGTEVYEGDVLCFPKYEGTKHQTRWVMSWNEERAAWSDYSPKEKAQVIGNIYENPDLLTNLCSLYE